MLVNSNGRAITRTATINPAASNAAVTAAVGLIPKIDPKRTATLALP